MFFSVRGDSHKANFKLFLSDKRVSKSAERRTDWYQRVWRICHGQKYNTGGTYSILHIVSRAADI